MISISLLCASCKRGNNNDSAVGETQKKIIGSGVLRIGMEPCELSYCDRDPKNNQIIGFEVEINALLVERLNKKFRPTTPVKLEIVPVKWQRLPVVKALKGYSTPVGSGYRRLTKNILNSDIMDHLGSKTGITKKINLFNENYQAIFSRLDTGTNSKMDPAAIMVAFPIHYVSHYINEYIALSIVISFIIIVVISGICYLVAYSITHELSKLAEISHRLAEGDYSVQFNSINKNNEIGILSIAFNKMVNQLKSDIELLDDKVKARTRELENSYQVIKEDLTLAKKVQQKILFNNLEGIEGLRFHCLYMPIDELIGKLLESVNEFVHPNRITDHDDITILGVGL